VTGLSDIRFGRRGKRGGGRVKPNAFPHRRGSNQGGADLGKQGLGRLVIGRPPVGNCFVLQLGPREICFFFGEAGGGETKECMAGLARDRCRMGRGPQGVKGAQRGGRIAPQAPH